MKSTNVFWLKAHQGRFKVSRAMTVSLIIISASRFLSLGRQCLGIGDQSYPIAWLTTGLTITFELAILSLVWWVWLNAWRKPSVVSRSCLNWLLSLYVVNVWDGGGVWTMGP